MNKLFSLFLDRLAERFAALLAGSISARVEGLHAAAQADQQSQLEDLARKYEADEKPEIAATLRQRAARLTSSDLAAEAVEVVRQLTEEPPRLPDPGRATPPANLRELPGFGSSSSVPRKKPRRALDTIDPPDQTGAAS